MIQCLVLVPVCRVFYVLQKPNIKQNPNGIKTDGELFWNIWDFSEEESTRNGVWGGSCRPPVRRLRLYFCRKKANFMRKIWAKDSPQSELRISRYKGNGEGVESKNAETERNREIDPISEGLSPLPSHGSQGPEGKPFSHLGRRSRKKNKKGGSLHLASGGAGTPPGAIIITAIFTNTAVFFTNISITFPHLSTAVLSPATHCTLYLNMVLYASYYFPMMCCHPMMSE